MTSLMILVATTRVLESCGVELGVTEQHLDDADIDSRLASVTPS
jgi:hypothetical protein